MYKGMNTVEMNFQFHFEILHFTGTEQTSYEITICKKLRNEICGSIVEIHPEKTSKHKIHQ